MLVFLVFRPGQLLSPQNAAQGFRLSLGGFRGLSQTVLRRSLNYDYPFLSCCVILAYFGYFIYLRRQAVSFGLG